MSARRDDNGAAPSAPDLKSRVALPLSRKITFALLGVSLTGILLIGTVSFYFARDALYQARSEQLLTSASDRKKVVVNTLAAWKDAAGLIQSRTQLRLSLAEYTDAPNPVSLAKIQAILSDALASTESIQDIQICDPKGGLVLSAGRPGPARYNCSAFEDVSKAGTQVRDIWLSGDGELYALMTGPLELDGRDLGIIHIVMSAHEILAITQSYDGLGETGEMLLAEQTPEGHARFLTPLRYDPNPNLTRLTMSDKVNAPIIIALQGNEVELVTPEIRDYRGNPVLAATAYIPETGWGIVTEIDREEAIRPVKRLFASIFLAVGAIVSLATLIGFYLGRLITAPILDLVRVSRRVEAGDMSQTAGTSSRDEIGYLAESFNRMLRTLDRKTLELEESESRLRAIIDNTVDGVITIDERGTIQSYNKACEDIFGYGPDEAIGRNVKILMPEPYHSEHDGYLKRYRDTGEKRIIGIGREVEGKRKNGETFPLDLSVSEVNIEGRKIYSGLVRDITQRKQAENEILRSNEELERFAYVASHDLQEPLRMIVNFTALLDEEYKDQFEGQAAEYMEFVISAARRMQNLISDLLEYSRIGHQETGLSDVDCQESMGLILENLEEAIHESGAQIIFENLPVIRANPVRFSRLMQNIIGNGLKYKAPDRTPEIHIVAQERADEWLFSVTDNGIGIKEEYLEQIFVIFKRLHGKNEYSGTGIGLAVCRRIAESFGGRIWAESTPGQGSTFHFTVPKQIAMEQAA